MCSSRSTIVPCNTNNMHVFTTKINILSSLSRKEKFHYFTSHAQCRRFRSVANHWVLFVIGRCGGFSGSNTQTHTPPPASCIPPHPWIPHDRNEPIPISRTSTTRIPNPAWVEMRLLWWHRERLSAAVGLGPCDGGSDGYHTSGGDGGEGGSGASRGTSVASTGGASSGRGVGLAQRWLEPHSGGSVSRGAGLTQPRLTTISVSSVSLV